MMITILSYLISSESILSMELCSGPPSLSLPPPADESNLPNPGLEVHIALEPPILVLKKSLEPLESLCLRVD